MSVSPPFRTPALILTLPLLLTFSCKGGKDGEGRGPALKPELEIPEQWQSQEAAIVMRLTNATTTSTEVRRALNELANGDPLDPTDEGVDPLHLLMRLPETDPATGELLEPDSSLSTGELLAGSSIDQAVAFRQKIIDGDGTHYAREEAVDACGNEMVMSVVSPHAIQKAIPAGANDQEFWSASCTDGLDCETVEPGSWDVALGEMRFDGMIDMVVNLFPNVQVDPVKPGAFGHLTGFFLTDNNPGFAAAPLIANMRRVQINMTGVWELEEMYVDPVGYRELYKFPHRARELTQADLFVFLEGHPKGEEYWKAKYPDFAEQVPQGLAADHAVAVDVTSVAGQKIVEATGGAEELNTVLYDALVYQIGAAIACPSVRETQWVRRGPVEFFMCPGIDIETCVATEDLEEGACSFLEEPEPSFLDPTAVSFDRVEISGPGVTIPMIQSQLPVFLSTPLQSGTVDIEISVAPGTVLQLKDSSRILGATSNTNGVEMEIPAASSNDHCPTDQLQRLDLGSSWPAGGYTLTVDLGTGTDWVVDDSTGDFLLWFYLSSVDAWKQR